jgi:hypothetical protein
VGLGLGLGSMNFFPFFYKHTTTRQCAALATAFMILHRKNARRLSSFTWRGTFYPPWAFPWGGA